MKKIKNLPEEIQSNFKKILITNRLILRTWKESDFLPFCKINQDPKVMEFFPNILTQDETESFILRIKQHFNHYGYTLYAVELKETGEFIGYTGLWKVGFDSHFTPATEIGWRLSFEHWGKGYAPEAAKAVLEHAFKGLGLDEIVSFTFPQNKNSIRVMEKIGLQHDLKGNFIRQDLKNSPLAEHVLYRTRSEPI